MNSDALQAVSQAAAVQGRPSAAHEVPTVKPSRLLGVMHCSRHSLKHYQTLAKEQQPRNLVLKLNISNMIQVQPLLVEVADNFFISTKYYFGHGPGFIALDGAQHLQASITGFHLTSLSSLTV